MDVFKYDTRSSYETNFTRWHSMNSSERRFFNEEVLTSDHAKLKFDELYGSELRSYGATILSKSFS